MCIFRLKSARIFKRSGEVMNDHQQLKSFQLFQRTGYSQRPGLQTLSVTLSSRPKARHICFADDVLEMLC